MENIIINPENYREDYIKNLNECFNGWGGNREYEWGLERKVGQYSSDILLIENEEDGVIAGSAVSYRTISGNDKSFDIGIMTGSWTLPAARRKGCFKKMINSSKDLCQQKGVPFLTAFVTETNPSRKALEAEGFFLLPTYHLFSPEDLYDASDLSEPKVVSRDQEIDRDIFETVRKKQFGFLNFTYNFEEFRDQYLNRIKETTILKINNDYTVIEDGVNEVKILLLTHESEEIFKKNMKAVTNWCLKNKSKKAFFFTTRTELFLFCEKLGFANLPGYFTVSNLSEEDVSYDELFESLNINMADKM